MVPRCIILVPSLVLLAGVVPAFALDNGAGPTPVNPPNAGGNSPQVIGPNGNVIDIASGRPQGSGRQVVLLGLLDLDAIQEGNYFDGNSNNSDHRSEGWIRAEFGAKIDVDERVTTEVTVAYQGIAGQSQATSTTNAPPNGQSGNAVINTAYVKLQEFLNYRELTVSVGRQNVWWSVRGDPHPGFLYDSRANNPTITGWDGIQAAYNLERLNFNPYVFRMPDNSSLYGIEANWEPDTVGNNRLYFTASANLERNVTLKTTPTTGDKLYTYYVGADADFVDFELFGQGALQRGVQGNGIGFAGYAFSGGIDWHLDNDVVLGVQGDYFSGDDNAADQTNHAFINNWEAISDTFIVEHEKYGELSRLLDGNLTAGKVKMEFNLDPRPNKKGVRLKMIYGNYRINKAAAGASRNFGQEGDISLAWDYTANATITLLGGVFKPGEGYRAVSAAGVNAGTDFIYVFAANLKVRF